MSTTNIFHKPLKGIFGVVKTWAAVISAFFMTVAALIPVYGAVFLYPLVYSIVFGYHLVVRDSHYNEVAGYAIFLSLVSAGIAAAYGSGVLSFTPIVFTGLLLLFGAFYRKGMLKLSVHDPYA